MAEEQQIEGWQMGKRYPAGSRVMFRSRIWVAQHLTEVRPGLSRSWKVEPNG